MKNIIYYVATSVDGYISGPNDNVNGFIYEGNGIQKYQDDIKAFNTVIMGKNTYEFGYKFGLKPGEPSPVYSHMKHYVFSNSLTLESKNNQVEVRRINIEEIEKIRNTSDTDIYLCGGGTFAGWLLQNEQIDLLTIKLNPMLLGGGVAMFGNIRKQFHMELLDTGLYENGLQIMTYKLKY